MPTPPDFPLAPVEHVGTGTAHRPPEAGIALCLSGGGYRAMLFHVGALWRLNDAGYLPNLERLSSVSGGSIVAGVLGLRWNELAFDAAGRATAFVDRVVTPVRNLADQTIDAGAVIGGILIPGVSIAEKVAAAYRDSLFDDATLQDLPDRPRFVFNATNVQSGALWRFMKPYMRDYLVGEVKQPRVPLAIAVGASSAFPPVLSPVRLKLDPSDFTPGSGLALERPPFTTDVVLTDGGVYDNLGLETAWKRYRTVLVSDAGGRLAPEPEPETDWMRHTLRILELVDHQVRSLRKRQVIASFEQGQRDGAYWGIRTEIANYRLGDALPCPADRTQVLAEIPTRLQRLEPVVQERLINWGYAVCDAALRRHVDSSLVPPTDFPYQHAAV